MVIDQIATWLATTVAAALLSGVPQAPASTPSMLASAALRTSTTGATTTTTAAASPRGLYQFLGQVHSEDAASPSIDGALLVFTWSQVEPSKGVFDWSPVEAAMAPWVAAGKKVALRIHTASSARFNASWNGNTAGQATPSWVYAQGVRSVTDPDGSILPVYWDAAYQHEYWLLIKAFANRYNADSRVAWVEAASGFDGESTVEPSGAIGALARWEAVGYTDSLWQQTVFWSWDVYRHWFTRPIVVEDKGVQVSGINTFRLFADHAVRAGLWVNHNGLSEVPYTWNYAAALKNAAATTGCALEEREKLALTDAGAAALGQRISDALRVGCRIVLLYPGELHAGLPGSPTYSPAWAGAVLAAHTALAG